MLAFFSVRIKQLRTAKQMTQAQVAMYVGVSRSVISAYESDMRYPSYEILIRLSALFGVSTDFLLGVEEKRYLDISDLTEREAAAVYEVVELLRTNHLHSEVLYETQNSHSINPSLLAAGAEYDGSRTGEHTRGVKLG